jgi:hypothetical protein
MTTLTKSIIKALPDWRTFRELYHEFRHKVDAPRLQKELNNLLVGGILEKHETSGRVSYRAREPRPSVEPTGQELTDLVLTRRMEDGTLRSGDWARLRRGAQQAKLREVREEAELMEQLEDLARRPGAPDLSLEDIRRWLGVDHDE